jgi:signal recognition particle subunit SRP54
MFDTLTARLSTVLDRLRGRGVLSEENVAEALREVRRALLEADVNVRVARSFVARVKEEALGAEVGKGIRPGQQMIGIIHDEMVRLLGGTADRNELDLSGSPPVSVMLLGLQGSGKTTLAAKLALHIRGGGRQVGLMGLDPYRPAAGEQLSRLAERIGITAVVAGEGEDPVAAADRIAAELRADGADVVVADTAGRQTIDDALMEELSSIQRRLQPRESLLVLDAMTGQDAVATARTFSERLECTGAVLTKLDGDTRGGAALSLREVTGLPIRFAGTGEDLGALEVFHADRMAGRILGMGDVVSLVERATADAGGAEALAEEGRKFVAGEFTLEDFREQMRRLKGMGSLQELVGMLPGHLDRALAGQEVDEASITVLEAMIDSMTPEERRRPGILDGSRRRRIARGSGRSVSEVNTLLKQYSMMQKMAKALKGKSRKGRIPFPPMFR